MKKTLFISGHLDLTQEEFDLHYAPTIRSAYASGHSFVVGDAKGCDLMAQQLLHDLDAGSDPTFTVYHMFERPRNCVQPVALSRTVGGFTSDEERDAAMTQASDEDIAWLRPSNSSNRGRGTRRNLERRKQAAVCPPPPSPPRTE